MEEIKKHLTQDENILWEGNNELAIRKHIQINFIFALILYPAVLFTSLIIYFATMDIFAFLIVLIAYCLIITCGIYSLYKKYRNLKEIVDNYIITTKRIIQKSRHISKKYYDFFPRELCEIMNNIIFVKLKDIKKFEIKKYLGYWDFFFYLDYHEELYYPIYFDKIEDTEAVEKILIDLIPTKPKLLKNGILYLRKD